MSQNPVPSSPRTADDWQIPTALMTDHYELTMLQAALKAGTAHRRSRFELFTRRLPSGRRYGVVAGVGGYGNSLGLPNIGGETVFDASYAGNPLVNALCVGTLRTEDLKLAFASGEGNRVILFGSRTGLDGIGGVSVLASDTFEEGAERKLPAVILARHDEAVAKFEQRVAQFNQAATKAASGDEAALAQLTAFFDENPTKRRAAPVDPKNLPWRTPEPTKRMPAETQTAWFQNLYGREGTRLAQVGNSLAGLTFITPPDAGSAPTEADLAETPETQRTAAIVALSGFHSATAPSQPGIVPGATKALDRKPSGHTRICT